MRVRAAERSRGDGTSDGASPSAILPRERRQWGRAGSMWTLKLVRGAESADGARVQVTLAADGGRCIVGRDPSCDWHLPDRTLGLSARHCELLSTAGRLSLRDLSTNGTFVNGSAQRVQGQPALQTGDRFSAGPYQVEVQFDAAATASSPAPAATRVPPPAGPASTAPPAARAAWGRSGRHAG